MWIIFPILDRFPLSIWETLERHLYHYHSNLKKAVLEGSMINREIIGIIEICVSGKLVLVLFLEKKAADLTLSRQSVILGVCV